MINTIINRLTDRLKCDCVPIISALITAVAITCMWGGLSLYAGTTQRGIANAVIRLHVRANSDSPADQKMKLGARDAVLAYIDGIIGGDEDIGATRLILMDHMRDIEAAAASAIREGGADYAVLAYLTSDTFPTKSYGDVSLPAGRYEALRVDIGEAKGQNWWCVVYPALCYSAAIGEEESGPAKLKNVLTAEQYNIVVSKSKIRFRILELFSR